MVNATLREFSIDKNDLLQVDESERNFFLILGLSCNELIILQKIYLGVIAGSDDTNRATISALISQRSFLNRLILGKLFEAWEKCYQQILFQSPFRRDYEDNFDDHANEKMETLRKFFGGNPYVARIRNTFAFHYPKHELSEILPHLPEEEDWNIYLNESVGNSLYYLPEMMTIHAIISGTELDTDDGMKKISEDCTSMTSNYIGVATKCMSIFLQRNFDLQMSDGAPICVSTHDAASVRLPYFIHH